MSVPAAAPRPQAHCAQRLRAIGAQIRQRRRRLGVSTVAAAAAAGISRVTLHRIETGSPSVSVAALMNVLDALDLPLSQLEDNPEDQPSDTPQPMAGAVPELIELAAYPLLRQLAWHVQGTATLHAPEAAALYARHRQRQDLEPLQPRERQLIEALKINLPGADVPT